MNPLGRLISALAVVAVAALGGYGVGRMHQRAIKAEQTVDVAVETIERHDQAVDAGRVVEVEAVDKVKRVDAYFAGLKRLKPETPHVEATADAAGCRLDPDRLRRWTAANAGPEAAAPGESDDAGGSATAAGEWLADGPVQQPPGVDAPVLADARELPGVDQVAGDDR